MRASPAGTHGALSGAGDVRSGGTGASRGPRANPPKALEKWSELGSSGGLEMLPMQVTMWCPQSTTMTLRALHSRGGLRFLSVCQLTSS